MSKFIPDHPAIARTLRTGYPDPEPQLPRCPICGEECETVFFGFSGTVAGCDVCLEPIDSWKYKREFEG